MIENLNILICPLEWGLGHASRMIPLARKLRDMNNNIFIGSGEMHASFFKNELKGLSYINFTGFKPRYSRFLPQYITLLLKTPLLIYHIAHEHLRLKKIIQEYDIDIVISDNRFGLWNRQVTTVYVTHMPLIPFPKRLRFLEFTGKLLHRIIIKKYSLCIIPDLPGPMNLSGRLSHGIKLPENVRFAGILSRFGIYETSYRKDLFDYPHNTVILSGPEPQREILKKKLTSLLKDKEPATVIFEGRPEEPEGISRYGKLICYNHLPAPEMKSIISGSCNIIARSGYTSIMDLISLNCSALLIPTPGQTEQEYLAEYLSEKGWFSTIPQKEIDESTPFPLNRASYPEEIVSSSRILLEEVIKEISEKHHEKNHPKNSGK